MNRRQFIATTVAGSLAFSARSAQSNPKLRVAVIGHTGHGNYGHGLDTMWAQLPETEIVAVADADATGLAAALKRLKVTQGFPAYQKMLSETKPDLVVVGPRHVNEHRDMTLAAIQAGAKGIYIEKPLCRTLAEADEIVAAADREKTKIAVAHRNRYHPTHPVVVKLLQENLIGRVLEMRARGKEDLRGGGLDLWVLGSHLLNLATAFGGQPQSCSATVFQDGRLAGRGDVKPGDEGIGPILGNEIHARFEMERGFPLFFDSVQKAGVAAAGFGLQIIGTKGIIDFRGDKDPAAYLLAGSPFQPGSEALTWQAITSAGVGKPEPIANLGRLMSGHVIAGRDLIAAMREDREPLCSARDGRTTLEMISAVFESHRLNGQRVGFPLQHRDNPLTRL